jgi:hypothetical protein
MFPSSRSIQMLPPAPVPNQAPFAQRQSRPRTTSEPPKNNSKTGTGQRYYFTDGTCSLRSINGNLRLIPLRKKPEGDTPSAPGSIGSRNLSGSIVDSTESVSRIQPRLAYHEQQFHGTLTRPRQHADSITEDDETLDKDDAQVSSAAAAQNKAGSSINIRFTPQAPDASRRLALQIMLRDIYAPYTTEANRKRIDMLENDVCDGLIQLNIGPKEFKRIQNELISIDNWIARLFGGTSALGFIGGGQAWAALRSTLKNILPPGAIPFAPGAITGIADRLLSSILSDVRSHIDYYTRPDLSMLVEVMQECLVNRQRPITQELLIQAAALSAPYSTRNVVETLAAPVAAHFDRDDLVATLINGLGGIPAGTIVEGLRIDNDRQDGLMGLAYFFGRKDWKLQVEQLRDPSHRRVMRLINRTCKGSADIPDMLFNACKRLFTLESATEISLLMLGFACNEWLKGMAAEEYKDASPEASAFVTSATETTFLAILYLTLSSAMTGAGRLTQMLGTRLARPEKDALAVPRQREPVNVDLR